MNLSTLGGHDSRIYLTSDNLDVKNYFTIFMDLFDLQCVFLILRGIDKIIWWAFVFVASVHELNYDIYVDFKFTKLALIYEQ